MALIFDLPPKKIEGMSTEKGLEDKRLVFQASWNSGDNVSSDQKPWVGFRYTRDHYYPAIKRSQYFRIPII